METLKNYYETRIKNESMPNFEDLDESILNSIKRSFGFAAFKFEKSTSMLKHSMLLSAAQITRAIKPVNKRLEFDKQLARWIYWEDDYYYCYECVQKRLTEINENKEFSEGIDYEGGDTCGYYEDYADEDYEVECCKCHTPLYSKVDC